MYKAQQRGPTSILPCPVARLHPIRSGRSAGLLEPSCHPSCLAFYKARLGHHVGISLLQSLPERPTAWRQPWGCGLRGLNPNWRCGTSYPLEHLLSYFHTYIVHQLSVYVPTDPSWFFQGIYTKTKLPCRHSAPSPGQSHFIHSQRRESPPTHPSGLRPSPE